MTNYVFTKTIPAAANSPSNDQPKMLVNNASTNDLIGVDHITFNLNNGGVHNQTTYQDQTLDPTTNASQMKIWNNGNDLKYRGQNSGTVYNLTQGGIPTHPFQAWAVIQINPALPVTILANSNVASFTSQVNGSFTMHFTTALISTNYGVLIGSSSVGSVAPVTANLYTGAGALRTVNDCSIVFQQGTTVIQTSTPAIIVCFAVLGN